MIRQLRALSLAAVLSTSAAAADIQPFDTDGMRQVLQRQAGRPFVMLVWSLDCTYCHASMQHLQAMPRAAFDIVTVAIETADEAQNAAAIQSATAQLGDHASRWAFAGAPGEQLRYQIDPKWHGELPRSYWYDASGRRVAAYSGLITPAVIAAMTAKVADAVSESK